MPDQVTQSDLHEPAFPISALKIAPGVQLTDLQKRHVAITLDMFGAKGTLGKLNDNFTEDAVYEDLFAKCKNREEVAGQLLHLPDVCNSATTKEHEVVSNKPMTTSTGSRQDVPVNEIGIKVKHEFEFKAPLPKGGRTLEMNTTLLVYSSEREGKIVRLQDRPLENIPDNSFITMFRKMNAVGLPKVAPGPQTEKQDAEKMLNRQSFDA